MSIVNRFLKFEIICGFVSIRLSISSKTILRRTLWNFTPRSSCRFWKSSKFSNWSVSREISSNWLLISGSTCDILGGVYAPTELSISADSDSASFDICSERISCYSIKRVYILKSVDVISVRMSQMISSSFYIGPDPSGPIPAWPCGLEKVPVWL